MSIGNRLFKKNKGNHLSNKVIANKIRTIALDKGQKTKGYSESGQGQGMIWKVALVWVFWYPVGMPGQNYSRIDSQNNREQWVGVEPQTLCVSNVVVTLYIVLSSSTTCVQLWNSKPDETYLNANISESFLQVEVLTY